MIGIAVFQSTTEPKVVRNLVIAMWIADITHVAVSVYGLGLPMSLDIAKWNPMVSLKSTREWIPTNYRYANSVARLGAILA